MRPDDVKGTAPLVSFILLAMRLLGKLPLPVLQGAGRRLGRLIFRLDRRHREIALNNLRFVFGDQRSSAEIDRMAEGVFQGMGQLPLEVCWSLAVHPRNWKKFFKISGLEHYRRAMAEGNGVLCLTAHVGTWELLPIVGAMTELPLHVVYRPLDAPILDEVVGRVRRRFGARLIPKKKSVFKINRVLRNGECIAILLDQNVDWYEGVFVDFMGHRACTSKGLATLSILSGAPVVPVFLVREGGGFHACFEPPLYPLVSGDRVRDLEDNTQRYNRAIEAFVRRHPDQWFWVHQRWKTRPYHPIPVRPGP
jgi:KDO2-lipid IV(A) lauroyltransferase